VGHNQPSINLSFESRVPTNKHPTSHMATTQPTTEASKLLADKQINK
jgi:hypothetical protein